MYKTSDKLGWILLLEVKLDDTVIVLVNIYDTYSEAKQI